MSAAPKERILELIGDMEQRLDWAEEIVLEGEESFGRPENWRSRESMKSIFIDLNTAADRIPENVREKYPAIPWHALRGLRNVLAHDYASVRHDILWKTASRNLPQVRTELTAMRSDVESWT